ncbi:MAG TPA: right-handed parallel beta-helix repeat-containing protein [Thermoleophilaceae bacterium]
MLRSPLRKALLLALAVAVAALAGPSSAGAAVNCDKTIDSGESVSSFLNRLGPDAEGCLAGGTYTVGNLTSFQTGQKLHPAPAEAGGYQDVTLRGTLDLNAPGIELSDLSIKGVQNSQNVKIIEVQACDYCRLDHLDISPATKYTDFQGILNNTPTTGLEITNNKIHDVGDDGQFDHGIYCAKPMTQGAIRGNWIYGNAAYGIQFYPNCDGVDFSYNVLDGNGALAESSSCGYPQPACPASSSNGRAITFAGEGSSHSDDVQVHNNVLSTFGGAGRSVVSCYLPGAGDQVRDSLLYQSSGSDDACGSSISRTGLIHGQNPLYRDRLAHDYRLQPGSPARALMGAYADAVPGPRLAADNPDPDPDPTPPPADTTPPDTSIGSGPHMPTTSSSASFSLSSTESGSSFQCKLDGAAWGSCSSPKAYSGLPSGEHSFYVRATDSAGNTDPTPDEWTWTIDEPSPPPPATDTAPPETKIVYGPHASTTSTSAGFAFRSSEARSRFQCRLDGAPWSSCASPKAYTHLAAGKHSFQVRAIDAAGNVDRTPDDWTWTIERRRPSSPGHATRATTGPSVVLDLIKASRRSRSGQRRLRIAGRLVGSSLAGSARVRIQVATSRGWRTLALARSSRSGRFGARFRLRSRASLRGLRVRAVVRGLPRSAVKRVRLR